VIKPIAVGAALAVTTCATGAMAQVMPASPDSLAIGDWRVAPVAELRLRGEARFDVDDEGRGVLFERARLGADARQGPLELRVVLQDARAVDLSENGDFVGGPTAVAITGAHEAFAEVHTSGARPSFVRAGRQAVTWGEGRLLGASEWSPTGRALDAIRGRLSLGDGGVEALAAALSADAPTAFSVQAFAALLGVRVEWAFDPLLAVDASSFARLGFESPAQVPSVTEPVKGQTYTVSLRFHGEGQAWTWGVEGALQLGHFEEVSRFGAPPSSGARRAFAGAMHVDRVFDGALFAPALRLGAAYATGDQPGSVLRAFDPLLPDVHTWHGAMDLFAWSNEAEASARASASPWTDGLVALEYRYAALAQRGSPWLSATLTPIGTLPSGSAGGLGLGHEIDAMASWSPWAPLDVEVGYSALVLGEAARAVARSELGGAPTVAHWAYAEARVRF
jgi:hypothetical protein